MHLQTILDKLACIKQQIELLEAQVVIADEYLHSEVERDAFYDSVAEQGESTETLAVAQCTSFTAEAAAYEALFPSNPQGGD